MTRRAFSERDIHLALDGELPVDEMLDFEHWLAGRPDMKTLAARYEQDRAALRAALAGIAEAPVPQRLTAALETKRETQRGGAVWQRYAAAAILFLIGGLSGYYAASLSQPVATPLLTRMADNAIDAHLIYSNEKLHVVEVAADQRDHLQGWLSKRVGVKLVAPDLRALGYDFIGGRLLPFEKTTAAQFMYQDASGGRVSLYLTRDETRADTGYHWLQERGANALYWFDGGYGCAIAGTVPQATLTAIADAAYKQLLEG